jgi:hypothetical protein
MPCDKGGHDGKNDEGKNDQFADLRTRMVMAGHSKAEIVSAVKAAFENKQLPDLEDGARAYMMSKSAYLYDEGDHNGLHLFFTALTDGKDWGAFASGSPVVSGPSWFLSSKKPSQAKGLPPILVFAVEVAKWSDGTAAPMHQELTTSQAIHPTDLRLCNPRGLPSELSATRTMSRAVS